MLSAVILPELSYSAMLLAEQQIHQRFVPSGPLVLRRSSLKQHTPTADRKPTCLTTVWTQLAYRFNWRTAKPLGASAPPGCDEPTSRCQTLPSIWTLGQDKPVIPRVTFIWWSSTLLRVMVGSLNSTFVTDQLIGLSVKLSYAFALSARFPSGPREP